MCPRLSYIFIVPAIASFAAGIYFGLDYWRGQPNCCTDDWNVMYHDPAVFLEVLMMWCISAICVLKFLIYHGPFKRWEP